MFQIIKKAPKFIFLEFFMETCDLYSREKWKKCVKNKERKNSGAFSGVCGERGKCIRIRNMYIIYYTRMVFFLKKVVKKFKCT